MKLLASIVLASAAFAHNACAAQPAPNTAVFGAWVVDTTRLPMAPEARPKSVTITFSKVGEDRLRTQVAVVDPAGGHLDADGVTPLDGTPTRVTSNFEADRCATIMPRPEVLIMQLAKDGNPGSTRIYAVNADGLSMIETVAYVSPDGQPGLRKNYFSRLR